MKARLIKIGRDEKNDVVVNDASVSRCHLELFQDEEGNLFITDLNSSNGTFVNGVKLNGSLKLNLSDKVTIGKKALPITSYFQEIRPQSDGEEYEMVEESPYETTNHEDESEQEYEHEEESSFGGIFGLLILVVIVGGGIFWYSQSDGSSREVGTNNTGITEQRQEQEQEQGSSSQNTQGQTPAETKPDAWGCHQCSKVIYTNRKPDNLNCPVGYTYSGGSGSSHSWKNYGKQGTKQYSCKYCGLYVQVDRGPDRDDCIGHKHGQALTSEHTWKEL
jgi:pSer/pThr/pTyr-binding forkhead associated (FHA) protein